MCFKDALRKGILRKPIKQDARLMLVGPAAAGKTTMLCKVNLGDVMPTIPTVGFQVDTVEYKDFRFTVWEHRPMADKIKQIWRRHYEGTDGIIFVVDSSAVERLEDAKRELHSLLEEKELAEAVLLVVANKQDLPHAVSCDEICDKLDLLSLRSDQRWFLQPTSAVSGDGLYEGLDWLAHEIRLGTN